MKCWRSYRSLLHYFTQLTSYQIESFVSRPFCVFKQDFDKFGKCLFVFFAETIFEGESMSSTPIIWLSLIKGMTISEFEAESHAMCPGNSWTFATRRAFLCENAVPQTPVPFLMCIQATFLETVQDLMNRFVRHKGKNRPNWCLLSYCTGAPTHLPDLKRGYAHWTKARQVVSTTDYRS